MASIEIDFPGNLLSVATVADLRAVPSSFLIDPVLMLTLGKAARGDGLGGVYVWTASSLLADNGTTIIKPTDKTSLQAGRWIATGYIGGMGASVDATLAQLKAGDTSSVARYYDGAWFIWTLGNYTGKNDDVNVIKADSTAITVGAWVRQDAGKLTYQRPTASQYRTLQSKGSDVCSPLDYIPSSLHNAIIAGTSIDPISSYVQAAYNGSNSDSVIWRKGQYGIEAEIDTNGRRSIGAGPNGTRLVSLTSGQRSIFQVRGQGSIVDGFYMDCLNAQSGAYCFNSNNSSVVRCWIEDASRANIWLPETGNNSEMDIRQNLLRRGGRSVTMGNGTVAAGSLSTVTVSTQDPTTKGIILNEDYVKIGTNVAREITSFTSTTISFFPPLSAAETGSPVFLRKGANLLIGRNGDNSNIKSVNNIYQSAPLAGVHNQALYGVQSIGDTAEFNGFGWIIGRRAGGGELQTINWRVQEHYGEAFGEGAAVYHGSSRDGTYDQPVCDGIGNNGLDNFYLVDPATLRDCEISVQAVRGRNRQRSAGPAQQNLTFGTSAILFYETPDPSPTIDLIPPSAGSNGSKTASNFDLFSTIIMKRMSGKTLTLRATNAINDGAVTGGFSTLALTGSNRKVECRWDEMSGWTVTATS